MSFFVFSTNVTLIFLIIFGSKKSDVLLRAPILDLIVGLFTWIPWITTFCLYGLPGLFGCFIGQMVMLSSFCNIHTMLLPSYNPE